MKKSGLLNARLAAIVAGIGHGDLLVVADAGLPVPPGVECVDLAVTGGVPRMLDVLTAVAGELQVERFVLAEELLARATPLPDEVRTLFPDAAEDTLTHAEFKALTRSAHAVVRTGEFTPYANVILAAGVVF